MMKATAINRRCGWILVLACCTIPVHSFVPFLSVQRRTPFASPILINKFADSHVLSSSSSSAAKTQEDSTSTASPSDDETTKHPNTAKSAKTVVRSDRRHATKSENDKSTETAAPNTKRNKDEYDLPWTDMQEWALCDHLPRYTVQIPVSSENGLETMQVITLWRTLSNEVVELSGYPLQFLVDRQMELQERASNVDKEKRHMVTRTSQTILPYLDDFDFTPQGGLSGAVYGIQGVADGARIETTPVDNVHTTIPKGFVRTQDGSVMYELGQPRRGSVVTANSVSQQAQSALSSSLNGAGTKDHSDEDVNLPALDQELIQFGVLTTMVIAGAAAFETLSHHLTVNVFWV